MPSSDPMTAACLGYYGEADAGFIAKKDFCYTWQVRGDRITVRISDYLEGAPDDVLREFADMVCRRAKGMSWSEPDSFIDLVTSDDFITSRRPVFVRRSKNLLRTDVGVHRNLYDSVQRLLDSGLLTGSDVENSYFSWTSRSNTRRVGFCSTMMRVVGISSVLDDPAVPEYVLDYVVYHESLHLRQGYGCRRRYHDGEFRSWEHSFPQWKDADAALRGLNKVKS